MTEVCYCHFDESYANDDNDDYNDHDYQTDQYNDDVYDEDYETDIYDDGQEEEEVFLTNATNPKKDWFCCNCYSFFETKSQCLNHEKMCIKLL
jgi:hypothetical protein